MSKQKHDSYWRPRAISIQDALLLILILLELFIVGDILKDDPSFLKLLNSIASLIMGTV